MACFVDLKVKPQVFWCGVFNEKASRLYGDLFHIFKAVQLEPSRTAQKSSPHTYIHHQSMQASHNSQKEAQQPEGSPAGEDCWIHNTSSEYYFFLDSNSPNTALKLACSHMGSNLPREISFGSHNILTYQSRKNSSIVIAVI